MALPYEETGPEIEKSCQTRVEFEKLNYTWTIDNFSCCPQKVGETLQSETFSMDSNDKSEWCLKLYPKGRSHFCFTEISIELHLISCSKSEVTATVQFSLLNAKKGKIKADTPRGPTSYTFQEGKKCSVDLIEKECLLDEADSFLPNDKLTILCEISIVGDTVHSSGQSDFKAPECTLSKDYGLLFENQKLSDVTLSVKGQEFRVHKAVLAARSPVFQAMFEHEMGETKSSRVDITDIDHVVMQELLRFIYTGKVSNSKLEKLAEDLLAAADKYALGSLKLMCEQTLCKKLSVDNAVKILMLADLHSVTHLKTHTINYINRHMTAVTETREWKNMSEIRPHLIVEAYCALAAAKRTPRSSSKRPMKKRKRNI